MKSELNLTMPGDSDPPDKNRSSLPLNFLSSTINVLQGANETLELPIQVVSNNSVSSFHNKLNENLTVGGITNPQISTQAQNDNKRKKLSLRYDMSDMGPYVVYLESLDKNIGNLHAMTIGKLIFRNQSPIASSILNLEKSGKNRIKLTFRTFSSANNFLDSDFLKNNNLEAYIPQFLTRRMGVIRAIDLDISNEELQNFIQPISGNTFKILEVRRLNRKIISESGLVSFTPTTSVLVTFKGQLLPDRITLFSCIREVHPFIQRVIQCNNCLRFGHTENLCRGSKRCANCGENHSLQDCKSTNVICIHCKGNHPSNDRNNCPTFNKQKKIKETMAKNNISYRDALKTIESSFASAVTSINNSASTRIPLSFGTKNFPPIKRKTVRNSIDSETKRKHAEIIKPIPSNYNCISLNNLPSGSYEQESPFTQLPQSSPTDILNNSIGIMCEVIMSVLKDCSGSNPNLSNEIITNKLKSILNEKSNQSHAMEC